jgi:hypothetical protein
LSFDLITFSVYSLLPDKSLRGRIMDDLARMLRAGGSVLITFVRFHDIGRAYHGLAHLSGAIAPRFERGDAIHGPAVAHLFTWEGFQREMNDFGWTVAHIAEDRRYGRAIVKPIGGSTQGDNACTGIH